MKKLIRKVDEKRGITQITTVDERWYARELTDDKTGIPTGFEFVPSVTWIAGHYPKGIGFYKWLAERGWDESQAIKSAAGNKGSRVHQAITGLLNGQTIRMEDKLPDEDTGLAKELTLEEYDCLMSFVAWHNEFKPTVKANEITIWSEQYGYAGTVDLVCEIEGEEWIIDFKTSQDVWSEYELQISAYKHALEMWDGKPFNPNLAILQIGYRRNKNRYKWNVVDDKFDTFMAAREIWKNECSKDKPLQRDYPLALSLEIGKKK